MHRASLMGDDLSPVSPRGSLKRARNSFRVKAETRKELSRQLKIQTVWAFISFLPCANTSFFFFILCHLFFYLEFPSSTLIKSVKEINTLGLRKVKRECGIYARISVFLLPFQKATAQKKAGTGLWLLAHHLDLLSVTEPLWHFEDVNNIFCYVILSHVSMKPLEK